MDRRCLRAWEQHQLQHLDTSLQGNNYERELELHTLEVLSPSNANSKCGECDTSGVSIFKYNQCTLVKVKGKFLEINSKRKGQIKDESYKRN